MRTRETIDNLLNATEGEHYQFKEWKTKDDLREATRICCALANCGGGKFVLGVSDKRPRKIVGSAAFPQPERTRVDLMAKLRIRVDFYILEHENMRVLVFDVASRPLGLPIQTDGIAWWYHGDSLIPMPEDIRRMVYAESDHDFSADICFGAAIDDLDSGAIDIFRKIWVENSGNKRIDVLTEDQLLRDCGAITDEGVTYAALILFGRRDRLRKYLPHAEVVFEYRSKESAGPAAQREEFPEGFFNCFDRIWELVNLRNDNQHYLKKFQMIPVPTFNENVVREAMLNSAGHRSYQQAGSIFVRQYRNRIVFESPGGLPHGITVDNILDRQAPRNKLIANIFKLCGLIERSGQGMNLIFEQSIREAKPLPDFTGSDPWFVKLTLYGEVYDQRMLAHMKKLSDEQITLITKDDYSLLAAFYHGKGLEHIQAPQFEHLTELGIVQHTELGIELVDSGIMLLLGTDEPSIIESQSASNQRSINGQSAVNQRPNNRQSIKTDDKKGQIIAFIAENKKATSSQISQFIGLKSTRVRELLQELIVDGVIKKNGNYRYATYILKNKNE